MGGSTVVKRTTRQYSQGGRNNKARVTPRTQDDNEKKVKIKVQLDDYTALYTVFVFGSIDLFQSSRRSVPNAESVLLCLRTAAN